MFCLVQKYYLKSINPAFLFLFITAFLLSGCGSESDSTDAASSGQDEHVSFQLPKAVFGNKLDQNTGALGATISVDGSSPIPMTISGTTASVTLNNIPAGLTTFTILFTYDLPPYGPLDVALAYKEIDVTTGNNTVNFQVSDYDTASFDEDNDGISNIVELDENSSTSPVVTLCILGTAQLGECELGS
jgi:hypothetical protein